MDAALMVKLGADPSGLVAGMKTAENAVKATKLSLGDLQDLLKQLERERPQITDDAQLKQYNQTISALKNNIKDLQNVGVTGFDEFGKKIESTKAPLNEAFSGVRKLANILPGIGIGGLVALGFEVLAVAVESLIPALLGANAAQELVNKTMAQATGSVAGEIEGIKDLVAIVNDETKSRKDRSTAFKELQEQYPNAFKNMSLEKTSSDDLTIATDKLTAALIRQAQIKGLESTISKISGEINELLASSTTEIVKQAGAFGVLKAIITQGGPQNIFTDQLGDDAEKLKKLQDQLKAIIGLSVANQDNDLLGHSLKTVPDTLAATKKALEDIVKLEDDLAKPNTEPLFKRLSDSLDPSRAQLLSTKIAEVLRDNVKNGIDKAITDKEIGLMQEQLRRLINPNLVSKVDTRIELNPILEKDLKAFESTIPPQLTDLLEKLPAIKTDIKVDPTLVADKEKYAKEVEKLKDLTVNSLVGIGEGIAEDVGKALAGVKNPFGNILGLLGEGLEEIGKQLIIVGGLSQLIQKLLPTIFTPAGAVTSIVVGALAIAAGAALKAISNTKGVKAFAEGGIVTGPTNALIGEAGPEVVFPLDKLNRFLKGNTQNSRVEVVGQTVISGPNLLTVFKRATTNQRLV